MGEVLMIINPSPCGGWDWDVVDGDESLANGHTEEPAEANVAAAAVIRRVSKNDKHSPMMAQVTRIAAHKRPLTALSAEVVD